MLSSWRWRRRSRLGGFVSFAPPEFSLHPFPVPLAPRLSFRRKCSGRVKMVAIIPRSNYSTAMLARLVRRRSREKCGVVLLGRKFEPSPCCPARVSMWIFGYRSLVMRRPRELAPFISHLGKVSLLLHEPLETYPLVPAAIVSTGIIKSQGMENVAR